MKALMGLITALTIPLAVLNMLGDILSGIWLAVLGQWGAIGLGILFFFVSSGVLGVVLMPSVLLAAPETQCAQKGKTLCMLCFGALGSLWIIAVMTVWCCGVLFLFVGHTTSTSLIPRLIWSYGVATGPWAYIAWREQQGGGAFASSLRTFLAEVAYVVVMLLIIFTRISVFQAIKVFAGFMLVGFVIQMTIAFLIEKEMKQTAEQSGELYF